MGGTAKTGGDSGTKKNWEKLHEGSEERRVRNEIIKEVIKGIQKKAIDESDESDENQGKTTGGPDLMRSWNCSQIENEEEKESWKERGQKAEQLEEEQKLEGIVERRRIRESSLKVGCHAKSP